MEERKEGRKEICFKALAHAVVGPGRSKIYWATQQAVNSGRVSRLQPEGFLLLGKDSLSLCS